MAINNNFVVKNGLEVSTDLIFADANTNKVGIASTGPRTELDVRGGIAATDLNITGVATIATLRATTGIVTYFDGVNLNVSGVGTIATFESTTSTIQNLNATNLDVSGIGTIGVGIVTNLSGTNLNYSGIGTVTNFDGVNLNVSGIGTVTTLTGTSVQISNLNVTGVATIANLSGTNLNYSGIGTVGGIEIQGGQIQAVSGIATYYGDGSNLSGVTYGIGIRSDGSTIAGSGVTVIDFAGSGISTVIANSGIATIYVEAGEVSIPTQITLTDETSSATTHYLTFAAGSGNQGLKVDTSLLSYVPSTNTINATVTTATNTAITDETASASTHYITFVAGTSGNQTQKVDSTGLTYNPSTNTLSGNITGNAATVTTNANLTGDVTSIGNATSIASGVIVNDDISGSAAIAVSKLAASTISGVTLGSNLATLTRGTYLTGSNYNGSTARTWAVDATSANTASKVVARDASGDFSANIITCVDLNSTSDINLKYDIRLVENALETINQLNGSHFTWKKDNRKSIGVIAQEIEKVLPELVNEVNDTKTVNYNGLIGILIEAVKELSAKVEKLESEIS